MCIEDLEFRLKWMKETHEGFCAFVSRLPTKAGFQRIAWREGIIAGLKFRLAELKEENSE